MASTAPSVEHAWAIACTFGCLWQAKVFQENLCLGCAGWGTDLHALRPQQNQSSHWHPIVTGAGSGLPLLQQGPAVVAEGLAQPGA
jgi:hypothetical protein